MSLNTGALIKKLNKTGLDTLQAAAGLCLSRTNPNVEIEHWLLKLTEAKDTDLVPLFRQFEVDPSRLQADLTRAIDQFKTGHARTPTLSSTIEDLLREAWLISSIQYQAATIRTGVLLLALLSNEKLCRFARDCSREFAKISVESLWSGLETITAGTAEDQAASSPTPSGIGSQPGMAPGAPTKTPALDQYTINLTERARRGEIDPVIGRDAEVRQMVDILIRRRQNNPILTGEAGVGKTAVVEGFALRVARGDIPPALQNVVVRTLDLGLLQAGAGVKGEFENRLKQVLAEVKSSPVPIILFIDEAHTMIGAGGQAGQGDAANLLKPALARGELRTIAATTWAEYKKYFEKDAALARRFQVIKVEEPAEDRAVIMMRGITGMLEKHHGVRILDEAVEASVKLSARYIPGRQLPDKSVSLLDTACARVAIGQNALPPPIEDVQREIEHLQIEIAILEREGATGAKHDERLREKQAALAACRDRRAKLEQRWEEERKRVEEIRELRRRIEEAHTPGPDRESQPPSPEARSLQDELQAKTTALRELQGETPLMQVCVEAQTIAEVVAGWTGIPVGRMMTDEIQTVLRLADRLGERVIGQSAALEAIGQRIRTARANLTDPRRPVGVFLLVGPSGVGKTETALALAESLYGGENNVVVINMSEYQDASSVSNLKGAAAGLVGYGQGGILTEAVRRRPYSVVLLDEVEKAHKDVMELFFQVFDKGVLEDSEGREADFKNTIILLTSNVGTDTIMKLCADPDTTPEPQALAEALRPDLLKAFPPALLGRMITVPYYPISESIMRQIIQLQLGRIARRMQENHRAGFTYDDALVTTIAGRCREVESGARNVDHIITRTLLPEISEAFLSRMASGQAIRHVHVRVNDQGTFLYDIR